MTPQAFAADLATIPAMDDLTVRICSGGGDVWAAQAIGAMLENRLGTVTAQIEGICASAATIVASHCKVVKAAEDATYMIHPIKVNPNGFVDMEGLKQLMDALTVMRTNVLNQYAKKTGHTVEEVAAWMDATSWWTAAEAKENGFMENILKVFLMAFPEWLAVIFMVVGLVVTALAAVRLGYGLVVAKTVYKWIVNAEEKFGSGAGAEKKAHVIAVLRGYTPDWLDWAINERTLDWIVQIVFNFTKKKLEDYMEKKSAETTTVAHFGNVGENKRND